MEKHVPKRWSKNRAYACPSWSPNSWRSLPHAIEPDDLKKLLKKRFTPRDKCLILILLRTGIRISELLSLKVKDINLKQRIIIIRESAKTGACRVVYFSEDTYNALKKWFKVRDSKKQFLFYTCRSKKMSYCTARSIFNKCLKKTFLKRKGYTLHHLRHTFASELLSSGMPLESLQILMGHSSIAITRRYARLTNSALEKDYFRSMQIIERGGINGSYRDYYKI